MSYVKPPDISRIEEMIEAPAPKLPNTSSWTWFCCSCSRANQRPKESDKYSICRSCQHERCRSCSIRWNNRTISPEYYRRAYNSTMVFVDGSYTSETSYRLKQEEEDGAAKHGLETMLGKNVRQKTVAESLVENAEVEKARLRGYSGTGGLEGIVVGGGSGLESRDSGASEGSLKDDVGDIGSVVESLVI